jgi:hypothetical protein
MATRGKVPYHDIVGGPSSQELMFAFFDPRTMNRTVEFHTKDGNMHCHIVGMRRECLAQWVITGQEVDGKTRFKAFYYSSTRSGTYYRGDIEITNLTFNVV